MGFIEEFQQLLLTTPRYAVKHVNAENCNYADTAIQSGNCYYSFCTFYCEDVYYARYSRKCTNCSDITFCVNCEHCLECTDCKNGYELAYCVNCDNCSSCIRCQDCYSCKDCFGCVGLYQKQYYIFNKQYTEADYKELLPQLLQDQEIEAKIELLRTKTPLPNVHHFKTENCIGNNLSECKNCYQCYDGFYLEDCIYNVEANGNKDCVDITVCFELEGSYGCTQSPRNYDCKFLVNTDLCNDSEYCAFSQKLSNCFGCAYLAHKEYHILNKPYSPEAYEAKVAEIKNELATSGRYDMTLYFASDYERNRLATETDPRVQSFLEGGEMANGENSQKLRCRNAECNKEFIMISQEQRFYQINALPSPNHCPACRQTHRMALRNERALYKRVCAKCNSNILATYPETAPYTIYCQECFWENIG